MSHSIADVRSGRSLKFAALAVVLTALATGCGSASSTEKTSGSPAKQVDIGVALTLTGIPSFTEMANGAEAAASTANAKIQVVGPASATGSGEATMAQNLATSLQPDGFAVNPCILTAWTRAISSIASSVPDHNVIALGCPPIGAAGDSTPLKSFVGPSGYAQGYVTAQAAIEGGGLKASTTGNALIAGCSPSVPNIVEGVQGIVAAVKQLLPNITRVTFTSSLDQAPNTGVWSSQFSRTDDVVLAIGFCDQDAQSLLTLKNRNVGGNFVAGVAEPTGAELEAIKTGVLAGGAQQASWIQGNVAARLLADQARGQAIPSGWIDSGNYPITKANVDAWIAAGKSPAAQTQFYAPVADKIVEAAKSDVPPLADYFSRAKPPTTPLG